MAFYPTNWEATSAKQLSEYQSERERFLARGREVVGISVDSIMNTTFGSGNRTLGFPLCSDFWPHGEVAVLRSASGAEPCGNRANAPS